MTGEQLVAELAALADLPAYKVSRMMTHLTRVIQHETMRGNKVSLPTLGEFYGLARKAKLQKNAITGRGNGVTTRGQLQLPARRVLAFKPKTSKKFLTVDPMP